MSKASERKKRYITCLLLVMLCVLFSAVFYINLSVTPSFYCSDMYSDMMLAVELWEQKALFPDGWVYGNQLYVVSTPVLAALFYGIVGQPFVAMGLASSLMGIIFAWSFCWMLKPVLHRQHRLFALVFLMALVAFFGDAYEKTNGWQLFFTMCTYYACYGITAFLAFGCYIRSKTNQRSAFWAVLVPVCILAFGTGIQSLRQTAVMALPLLAVEFLYMLGRMRKKQSFWHPALSVTLLIVCSNVLGVIVNRFLTVPQVEIFGQTSLASPLAYVSNLQESLIHVFTLFIRAEEFPMYVGGMVTMLCVVLTVCLLARAAIEGHTAEQDLLLLLSCSVLCIFAIDLVLTMDVRPLYYFMILPLIAVLVARVFAQRNGQMIALVLLLGLFGAACHIEIYPACEKAYHRESQVYYQVSDYLVEQGYDTLYARWNRGEKIAIASGGAIEAGFWLTPFVGVDYICNPEIFYRNNDTAVYCFNSKADVEAGLSYAETQNIELKLLKYFEEADIYLYKASDNLMERFTPERIF